MEVSILDEIGLFENFIDGVIAHLRKDEDAREIAWLHHPTFSGVYLKHLVRGDDTNGMLSCHLVKIQSGHSIGEHLHEGKMELHEVIEGRGECVIENKSIKYEPGVVTVIPADVVHKVKADADDLHLFAKFVPALL